MFQSAINNLLAKNKFEKAYGVLREAHDVKVGPLIRDEIYKQVSYIDLKCIEQLLGVVASLIWW